MTTFNLKKSRLLSLDVFRGMVIMVMILVNTIGSYVPFATLDHSEWNGCTVADLVFPFFLFIVGISLVFSLKKHQNQPNLLVIHNIIKRTAIIFALGLLLNAFPHHFDLHTLRFYGVLQRIALCYMCASFLFLISKPVTQLCLAIFILIFYWGLMILMSGDPYSQTGNIGAVIDRMIFSSDHLYGKVFDPEGLLSTLPAISTTLFGVLTGIYLLSNKSKKFIGMLLAGSMSLCIGSFLGYFLPINKALWTSSYVLWTNGLALYIFAICYGLIDLKGVKWWSKPFEVFGMNALAVYFLHVFFLKIQLMIHIPQSNGISINLRTFIITNVFSFLSLPYASLLYASCSVLFWFLVLMIMYRKKIFIRV